MTEDEATRTPLGLELARAYCTAVHPSRLTGEMFHPKNETCETALSLMVRTVDQLTREQTERVVARFFEQHPDFGGAA